MKSNSVFKRLTLATTLIVAMVGLAGCGDSTSAKTSTSSSSSVSVKTSSSKATASSKARDKANNQIMSGQYKAALKTLLAVKHPDKQTRKMIKDLQNYLAAKDAYNDQEYAEASSDLSSVSSSSKPMRSAYIGLQNKVKQAQSSDSNEASTSLAASSSIKGTTASRQSSSQSNGTDSSSSNATATATATSSRQSNNSRTATSASSSVANSQAAEQTAMNVIDAFADKMNFNDSSYGIIPEGKNGNVYTFEVRQNNDDNSVSHLIGIYQYNAVTGAVTKTN